MSYTVTELDNATISWTAVPGADQYRVYLDGVLKAATPALQTAAASLGITVDGVYTVSVAAVNSTGEGPAFDLVMNVVNLPLPAAPSSVVIS